MSVEDEANFTVALRRRDGAWRWVVTCDRCGVDLSSADFNDASMQIVKIKGLDEMLAEDPTLVNEMRRRIDEGWRRARATRMPMIIDSNHDVVDVGRGLALQEVIVAHADRCGR